MVFAIVMSLAAAACWAVGSLVSVYPATALGAPAFTRYRMIFVSLMLFAAGTVLGVWETLSETYMIELIISGLIGIFLGDTALFATMRRMGPRRTAILFAMNAPITTVLGLAILGENLTTSIFAGCVAVMVGVVLAIIFGKKKSQQHHWEEVKGSLAVGIAFGLWAATCQAVGIIISKPVMDSGVDPVAASAIRVAVSALALSLMLATPMKRFRAQTPLTKKLAGYVLLSGTLGMGLGMTFLMIALQHGDSGVVATLAATSPVLMLPLIWLKTKEFPSLTAWGGALLVVVGTGLILNG